jgi:hypothetical protein
MNKAYRVEEMDGETVLASHAVEAMAPFEAARKALGVEVTLRAGADRWIRVVEMTDRPLTRLRPGVFEFRVVGRYPSHRTAEVGSH